MLVVRPSADLRLGAAFCIRTVTGAAFFGWVAFLIFDSGMTKSGLVILVLTAAQVMFVTVGTEIIDAGLRERTRYILGDHGLDIVRDEELRARVPYRHLAGIAPDRVGTDGVGSADLPAPDGSPYFDVWNGFTGLMPAMRPEYLLYMVPGVADVCAELRRRAAQDAPRL